MKLYMAGGGLDMRWGSLDRHTPPYIGMLVLLNKILWNASAIFLVGSFILMVTIGAYILLPWYSTARIWDLTWGNRPE